ncbi:MAG: adenine deaminase, partial [Bacteroidales bacterium]
MTKQKEFSISGNIIDIVKKRIFKGIVYVKDGIIADIKEKDVDEDVYILPGLIDSHIHIESSMLIPSEFARIAVVHGTVGVVADPHEIANVLGVKGVEFMIENAKKVNFKFCFGAPSCVPATDFESSGAKISVDEIETLMKNPDIGFMAEMMNFPGVVFDVPEVMDKIKVSAKYNKVIDGHAPGLSGKDLDKYIKAGISTDHECFTKKEAKEKIKKGMKILVREGSAAKNFQELIPLIKDFPESIMLCSDDKHPDDLIKGHVNILVKNAINKGFDIFDVIRAASMNPREHYGLKNGLLQKGDAADFIVVDNLKSFSVLKTYIDGIKLAENGESLMEKLKEKDVNHFECGELSPADLRVPAETEKANVIKAIDGQLITEKEIVNMDAVDGYITTNIENDILKIVVQNRYNDSKPSVAFIKGFGLKKGAIASTVAHDSHNIIA